MVIAGHLDTVFPEGTDVTVKHEGTKLRAPGIGDDDRGLAVVLAVVRAFEKAGVQTNGTVYFIGDVGEEGPGNLRGMRNLFGKELKGKVDYFISVDDAGLGIASRAVGSHRYRVTYKGPGGHSYGAFGIPNPIHALGRAIAGISDIQVPANPKTTFNVGVIQGGTSVNSIAGEASMEVDMRSEDAQVARRRRRARCNASSTTRSRPRMRGGPGRARRRRRSRSSSTRSAFVRRAARPTPRRSCRPRSPPARRSASPRPRPRRAPMRTFRSASAFPRFASAAAGDAEGAHSLGEWYDDGPNGCLGPQWAALIVAALAGVHQ